MRVSPSVVTVAMLKFGRTAAGAFSARWLRAPRARAPRPWVRGRARSSDILYCPWSHGRAPRLVDRSCSPRGDALLAVVSVAEAVQQLTHPIADLVADRAHGLDVVAGRVGKLPVLVALPGTNGQVSPQPIVTTTSAASSWASVQRWGARRCDVDADFRHRGDRGGIDCVRGFGAARPRRARSPARCSNQPSAIWLRPRCARRGTARWADRSTRVMARSWGTTTSSPRQVRDTQAAERDRDERTEDLHDDEHRRRLRA